MTTIASGGTLRVFGRGLGWNPSRCISATDPAPNEGTTLTLLGRAPVSASVATCFEASFNLDGIPAGEYASATITTPRGSTAIGGVVVLAPPHDPAPTTLNVDASFGGDVSSALSHAAVLSAAGARVIVALSGKTYTIANPITVPNRTLLLGMGSDTVLSFPNLTQGHPSGPPEACGAVMKATDMYFKPPNGSDINYIKVAGNSTMARCCDLCRANPECNAYSLMISEQQCILKRCVVKGGCATQDNADRTSAWLDPYRPESGGGSGVVGIGAIMTDVNTIDWALANFTLELSGAPAKTPAIIAQGSNFRITGLSVIMTQDNVSNALRVASGKRFTVSNNHFAQRGQCLWPPHSDQTDFTASVTVRFDGATSDGWFYDNEIEWKCSAFDLDTDNRIVFEDNQVKQHIHTTHTHTHTHVLACIHTRFCVRSEIMLQKQLTTALGFISLM